jgi:hypothetical protein
MLRQRVATLPKWVQKEGTLHVRQVHDVTVRRPSWLSHALRTVVGPDGVVTLVELAECVSRRVSRPEGLSRINWSDKIGRVKKISKVRGYTPR